MLPQGVRFDVFRRDNFTCVYCGRSSPAVTLECDHKLAVSKGGQDTHENLVTACTDCNRGKSAKDAPDRPTPGSKPHKKHALIGFFGHSIGAGDDEDPFRKTICWQFEILNVEDGFAVAQLFSWLDGRATDVKLIPVDSLADDDKYRLYATREEWLHKAEEGQRWGL